MNEREDYAVMDSRANYDTDAATVLEACGPKHPSWKKLSESWGDQQAVLVRFHAWDGKCYNAVEVIGVIR